MTEEARPTEAGEAPEEGGEQTAPPLSLRTRILLLIAGWLLILVGLAGLLLPGLQGILTLLLGAAVLSLVSERALRMLRWTLRPWHRAWRRTLRLRRRVLAWIRRH